jgi:hypothetical protein
LAGLAFGFAVVHRYPQSWFAPLPVLLLASAVVGLVSGLLGSAALARAPLAAGAATWAVVVIAAGALPKAGSWAGDTPVSQLESLVLGGLTIAVLGPVLFAVTYVAMAFGSYVGGVRGTSDGTQGHRDAGRGRAGSRSCPHSASFG